MRWRRQAGVHRVGQTVSPKDACAAPRQGCLSGQPPTIPGWHSPRTNHCKFWPANISFLVDSVPCLDRLGTRGQRRLIRARLWSSHPSFPKCFHALVFGDFTPGHGQWCALICCWSALPSDTDTVRPAVAELKWIIEAACAHGGVEQQSHFE